MLPMARPPRTPEERIAAECYCLPLRSVLRVISGIYDAALRPFGLRGAQLNLLVAIARMAGNATPAKLTEFLLLEKSTVSRDLDRMESNGWIKSVADGRFRRLVVTTAGRRLLADALPAWQEAQASVVKLIGKTAAQSFSGMAASLRDRVSVTT
jgi:DNA-binding MarR family transcriptional regulator